MSKTTAPSAVPAKKQNAHSGKKIFRKVEPYIWIAPSVILMAVFILMPIVTVFRMALNKVTKTGALKGFNNFENFINVVKAPAFSLVLKNTLVWTIAVVVLSTILGFMLALVLNNKFRGRKIARAIVVFPWATTLVILSAPMNWTPTPEAYFAWEIACGIFVTIPFVTFCVLSGLQSIDASYYEAATVDGANYWQKLFRITLPLVRSSLTVSTVLNIIYVFNSFPIIWTMTKGDPANHTDTLVTYLYKLGFYNGRQGEAAAVSVIGFLILLVCASVYMIYTLRKGDDY